MRLATLSLSLLISLAACTSNLKLANDSHGSSNGPMGTPVKEVTAYGIVTQVALNERFIQIKHGPIPSLNWAPMLMTFKVSENIALKDFQKGNKVNFVLELDKDENHQIKTLSAK